MRLQDLNPGDGFRFNDSPSSDVYHKGLLNHAGNPNMYDVYTEGGMYMGYASGEQEVFPIEQELTEIQQFIKDAIGTDGTFMRALGLALYNGASLDKIKGTYDLVKWFEQAPADVKQEFLDEFNEEFNNLRVCTHCGKFMHEGYLLDTQYACSDECAIALYDGDEAQLREDIRMSVEEDDGSDFFWTVWE